MDCGCSMDSGMFVVAVVDIAAIVVLDDGLWWWGLLLDVWWFRSMLHSSRWDFDASYGDYYYDRYCSPGHPDCQMEPCYHCLY